MKTRLLISTITLLVSIFILSVSASAETYPVPDNYGTIQEALGACQNGDTVIVRDGIWSGTDNRNLDFSGIALTLRSENGPADCIIDCKGSGRGFYFHNGETSDSIVDGFTIING